MAGGAAGALLFSAAAMILVAISGAPKAAGPQVRLSLARIDPMAASDPAPAAVDGPIAPPGDAAANGSETMVLASTPDQSAVLADDAAPMGEAVITLPDGQTSPGGAPAGAGAALPQAPMSGLFQAGPTGPLPVISPDGRTPAVAYARPFTDNGKPKVALVIGGLGLNAQATREAIDDLPPQVTLSFAPYADGLQGWIDLARAAGHEVLIEAPMEPADYPADDPGPYTLLANGDAQDLSRKLDWLMSRATGYFGLTNYLGARFAASPPAMSAFEAVLRRRGLAFIDDGEAVRAGGGIPRASADRIIDNNLAPGSIEAQLAGLERDASKRGAALGSGFAYPVTLAETAKWARALAEHGYQLAPASALAVVR